MRPASTRDRGVIRAAGARPLEAILFLEDLEEVQEAYVAHRDRLERQRLAADRALETLHFARWSHRLRATIHGAAFAVPVLVCHGRAIYADSLVSTIGPKLSAFIFKKPIPAHLPGGGEALRPVLAEAFRMISVRPNREGLSQALYQRHQSTIPLRPKAVAY
jgi:hypothetical protein